MSIFVRFFGFATPVFFLEKKKNIKMGPSLDAM
jgi:hypothetical protein